MTIVSTIRSDEMLAYFACYEWELIHYGTFAITLLAAVAVGLSLLFPPLTTAFVRKYQPEVIVHLRLHPRGIHTEQLAEELLLSLRKTERLMVVLERARVVERTENGWRLLGL